MDKLIFITIFATSACSFHQSKDSIRYETNNGELISFQCSSESVQFQISEKLINLLDTAINGVQFKQQNGRIVVDSISEDNPNNIQKGEDVEKVTDDGIYIGNTIIPFQRSKFCAEIINEMKK